VPESARPYIKTSNASPNTIASTKKLMTANPITRRRLIPAIANDLEIRSWMSRVRLLFGAREEIGIEGLLMFENAED
jgi:hypothetical protein